MTAVRVVGSHVELSDVGQLTHDQLDTYITGSAFLVVSGSGPLPPAARRLKAGSGITIIDEGPGGNFIVNASSALTGSSTSWMEEPSGAPDGLNQVFVLANVPSPTQALMFFVNGQLLKQGINYDYVLSGSIVTTVSIPRSGSNISATYPY